jgi:hypothetical protein
VGRIPDDGLIQITYLDSDAPLAVCDRTKIADMAISADPYRRPNAHRMFIFSQPFVELRGVPTHIGVRGLRHLQVSSLRQKSRKFVSTQ